MRRAVCFAIVKKVTAYRFTRVLVCGHLSCTVRGLTFLLSKIYPAYLLRVNDIFCSPMGAQWVYACAKFIYCSSHNLLELL